MKRVALALFVVSLFAWPGYYIVNGQGRERPSPGAEMQRLTKQIVGRYKVVERHHARSGVAEWVAEGTASYVSGPDAMSVFEQYKSNGPRGAFSAIAVIWWDAASGGFRHFECESGEPCSVVDDLGKWEGTAVVFKRRTEYQGRKIQAEDSYDFAQPDSIVITSRFSVDGGPMTTAMTITYTRT